MRTPVCHGFCFFLLMFVLTPFTGVAQERPQVFSLPEAHAGEAYKEQIEDVLREKYSLKLESGTPKAIIQWWPAGGELPLGMSVRTDGTIVGTLSSWA